MGLRDILNDLAPGDDHFGSPGVEAAVALIIAGPPSGPCSILLMERAARPHDPWSGHISFPGGRREAVDRDLAETARRETFEEVGIRLDPDQALGRLLPRQAWKRGSPTDLWVHPWVFSIPGPLDPVLSEEAASARWVGIEQLLDPSVRMTLPSAVTGRPSGLPALRLPPYSVWGLTLRILEDAFPALRPPAPGGGQ